MSTIPAVPDRRRPSWTFLTNHAHVLIAISRDPGLRQSDIAYAVGITVGAVQRIINELEADGYVETERVGRRNRYRVIDDMHLRHPLEDQHTVRELIVSLDQ
jgi:predicted transcriptional regulator